MGRGSLYQTMGVTESASAEPDKTVAALIPQASVVFSSA